MRTCAMPNLQREKTKMTKPQPKGILLLGPPGTGKSAFAKALAHEVGRPLLIADPGSWKGSLVGETGAKTRQALSIADAMAPAILFIDEIEKALAGASSQHQGDSGVSADQLGALLTWMQDHTSDVYPIMTSNNISALPPEFTRAERFDAIFFLDLPTADERELIWDIYANAYEIDQDCDVIDDGWTGAEIKACCRLAALTNVPLSQAQHYITPVTKTSAEKVTELRRWAEGRCLSATQPGTFTTKAKPATPAKRRAFQGATT